MQPVSAPILRLAAQLRAVTAAIAEEDGILAALEAPLRDAALDPAWIRPEFLEPPAEPGFASFLLHQEPDHSLAIFAVSWKPGHGAPPHDHGTWGLVGGVRGQERNRLWHRVDDGSHDGHAELVAGRTCRIGRGEVLRLRRDDIHSVRNEGAEVALSLHAYGRHLNETGRHRFDVDRQEMLPFIIAPR